MDDLQPSHPIKLSILPGLTHWQYLLSESLHLRSSREGDLQTPKMSKIVFNNCFCEKGGDMRQDFTTTTCGGRKQND